MGVAPTMPEFERCMVAVPVARAPSVPFATTFTMPASGSVLEGTRAPEPIASSGGLGLTAQEASSVVLIVTNGR